VTSKAPPAERATSPLPMSQRPAAGVGSVAPASVQTSARPSQVAVLPSPVRSAVQLKLAIGSVDDPLEHEADRVADQVMRMPDPRLSIAAAPTQISSCLDTANKWGIDKLDALRRRFTTGPWLTPALAPAK
jgi:hypothetical protein